MGPWISFVTDRGISILRRPTNSTLAQSFDVMQGQERMVWCQSDHWDLSVYSLLHCKTGAILQSIEASKDQPAYSARFENFKRDSKNQITAKSTNDVSWSICREDTHVLVQSER